MPETDKPIVTRSSLALIVVGFLPLVAILLKSPDYEGGGGFALGLLAIILAMLSVLGLLHYCEMTLRRWWRQRGQ